MVDRRVWRPHTPTQGLRINDLLRTSLSAVVLLSIKGRRLKQTNKKIDWLGKNSN